MGLLKGKGEGAWVQGHGEGVDLVGMAGGEGIRTASDANGVIAC